MPTFRLITPKEYKSPLSNNQPAYIHYMWADMNYKLGSNQPALGQVAFLDENKKIIDSHMCKSRINNWVLDDKVPFQNMADDFGLGQLGDEIED